MKLRIKQLLLVSATFLGLSLTTSIHAVGESGQQDSVALTEEQQLEKIHCLPTEFQVKSNSTATNLEKIDTYGNQFMAQLSQFSSVQGERSAILKYFEFRDTMQASRDLVSVVNKMTRLFGEQLDPTDPQRVIVDISFAKILDYFKKIYQDTPEEVISAEVFNTEDDPVQKLTPAQVKYLVTSARSPLFEAIKTCLRHDEQGNQEDKSKSTLTPVQSKQFIALLTSENSVIKIKPEDSELIIPILQKIANSETGLQMLLSLLLIKAVNESPNVAQKFNAFSSSEPVGIELNSEVKCCRYDLNRNTVVLKSQQMLPSNIDEILFHELLHAKHANLGAFGNIMNHQSNALIVLYYALTYNRDLLEKVCSIKLPADLHNLPASKIQYSILNAKKYLIRAGLGRLMSELNDDQIITLAFKCMSIKLDSRDEADLWVGPDELTTMIGIMPLIAYSKCGSQRSALKLVTLVDHQNEANYVKYTLGRVSDQDKIFTTHNCIQLPQNLNLGADNSDQVEPTDQSLPTNDYRMSINEAEDELTINSLTTNLTDDDISAIPKPIRMKIKKVIFQDNCQVTEIKAGLFSRLASLATIDFGNNQALTYDLKQPKPES